MRVLVIKLTSFGDIIHTLPALTDAEAAHGALEVDWVVDEGFADIPRWHPTVKNILCCAHRRWRKAKMKALFSGDIWRFVKRLRQQRYDLIIDAQSGLKTGIIAWLAKGRACGYDRESVREKGAEWFYQQTFFVPKDQHAITRIRQLFAAALGYALPTSWPKANIQAPIKPFSPSIPEGCLVFIPFTTWATKHWPMVYWQALINKATTAGHYVTLYYAGEREHSKALVLKGKNPRVVLAPSLSLNHRIAFFQKAAAFVGVDTGPSHLASALNVPGITLFGPTDPKLVGPLGDKQVHLSVDYPCAKCRKRSCSIVEEGIAPGCYITLSPDRVWTALTKTLKKKTVAANTNSPTLDHA